MRFLTAVAANLLGTLVALGGIFLLILIVMGGIIASTSPAVQKVKKESVLVLDLSGTVPEVVSGDPLAQSFGGESAYGLYDLSEALKRAASDKRVKALWLQTGNMQVSWATLQTIRRALGAFKESGKPVVASSNTFAMSENAYFLASTADSVFADPHAMIELNGFALTVTYYKELLDRLDIRVEAVRAGTYKSAVEPYFRSDLSDENREQLQAIVDDIMDAFVNEVAVDRGLEPAFIRKQMATGGLMTAENALDAGFLDGLRYDDEIRQSLATSAGLDTSKKLPTVPFKSYVRDMKSHNKRGHQEVAVVYAVGSITGGKSSEVGNPFSGGKTVGSETFAQAMRRARRNSRTKAIVVRIDSPGGLAPAADAMLREIRNAADEVPVVVSMGDLAASGGYWMAMGSETVVAEPLTLTGSIGVFSLMFDASGFMKEKIGITYDDVKSSPYADMFSGIRSLKPAEREMLQRTTDQVYGAFLRLVADSRHLSVEEVDALAQGRVWTGEDALDVGLVDELGGMDRAIELAADAAGIDSDRLGVRIYSAPRGFLERFTQPLASTLARIVFSLSGSGNFDFLSNTSKQISEIAHSNGKMMARIPFVVETN